MALNKPCPTLEMEKVSAAVYVGPFTFCTPGRIENESGHIMSFSITRNRNQPVATLQFTVDAWMDLSSAFSTTANNLGDRVVVKAGVGDDLGKLPTLFTGYVTGLRRRPNFEDARKIILEFSAEDEFVKMKANPASKFTRRFRMGDDAFAVITGGKRRQGGNLTQLKRMPPGKGGISFQQSGSSMGGEHSPLIKTPDPQGGYGRLSPQGAKKSSGSNSSTTGAETDIIFSPNTLYAGAGNKVFAQVTNRNTGEPIDVQEAARQAGKGCCLHCDPPPRSFDSGAGTRSTGLTIGDKSFPVSVIVGSSSDSEAKGFEFTITGDYPFKITFVHPLSGATCTIQFNIIPPHDHRDIARGGPAVGSYDVFQI
jgi:hypothetical protein